LLPAFLILFVLVGTTAATDPAAIVAIEEDWEMVLGEPRPEVDAPQVTCMFSPVGDVGSWHAVFELNHRSLSEFSAGGLQFQLWNGDEAGTVRSARTGALLEREGETVRWTQKLSVADGRLVFEVINGSSSTWGNFGDPGHFRLSVPTTLTDLSGYSPAVSVANSRIGYAENRVESLILKRVRAFPAVGDPVVDNTPRVVHQGDYQAD
jgi:hypothetical protein